jgi:hypothetical protein
MLGRADRTGVHGRDHRRKLVDLAIVSMVKIIWSIQPSRRGAGHVSARVVAIITVLSSVQIEYAARRRRSVMPKDQAPRSSSGDDLDQPGKLYTRSV